MQNFNTDLEYRGVLWQSLGIGGIMGIVKLYDPVSKQCVYYAGLARSDHDEKEDIQHIIDWGAKVHPDVFKAFFEKDSKNF